MKNHVDEDGFELIDHKDAAERSSHHVLSKRLSEEEGGEDINNLAHWNDKGRKKWTVLLFFGCLLVYATRTSVSICAVHMGKELGWDKELSGVVMSTFFFGYITTQILGGVLADRYGGDRMLFNSALVWSICTFLIPVVGDVFKIPFTMGIIVLRALSGIAQGIHFPAIASLLSKRVHLTHRNSVFAIAASGAAFGNVINGFAGSLLLEYHGWRSLFYLLGGASIFWVISVRVVNGNGTSFKSEQQNQIKKVTKSPWSSFLRSKSFWALAIASGTESFVFTSLMSWSPTYFAEKFPSGKGWLFNVLPWITSFISQNAAGVFSDRMLQRGWSTTKLRKFFVTLAGGCAACICLQFGVSSSSFKSALLYMSLMIGCLGTNSVGLAMNPQDLAPEQAGSLFGFMNTVAALTGMVGVYAVGHILESTKNWVTVYFTLSLISISGVVVYVLFGSGEKIESK